MGFFFLVFFFYNCEKPSYSEFDVSGNVLGLIFNQGMIWWEITFLFLFGAALI